MTDADLELPRGIALAWGVAANPQRGPKRELSIERIVDAAIELADAGGLQAVSMASVAGSLGFTTMSLYRYVTAKDDLVLLMQEQAHGVPPEAVREATGWREALRRWSAAQLDVYRRHPWLLDIPISGTPTTPNSMAWLDSAIAALATTPLDDDEKIAVCLAVMGHTRWQGTVERGYLDAAAAAGTSTDEVDRLAESALARLVTPEAFPEVARLVATGVFTSPDDPFVFALDRLFDGVEFYLQHRPADRPAPAPPPEDPDEVLHDKRVREAQKGVREVEKALREARKKEREARKAARERLGRS